MNMNEKVPPSLKGIVFNAILYNKEEFESVTGSKFSDIWGYILGRKLFMIRKYPERTFWLISKRGK